MANLENGPILARIGEILYDLVGGEPDGLFIYAEVKRGWIFPSAFKDYGDRVKYLVHGHELTDKIYEAWLSEEPDKRWRTMKYSVVDGRFLAEFQYPGEIDEAETPEDRRERVLQERYGNKLVVYPGIEEFTLD